MVDFSQFKKIEEKKPIQKEKKQVIEKIKISKPKPKKDSHLDSGITKYIEPFITDPASRKISSDKLRYVLDELTGVNRRPTKYEAATAIKLIMEILIPVFREEFLKRRENF